MDTAIIIPAAGQGQRMQAAGNKLLLPLGGQTILQQTLQLFRRHPRVTRIYLVVAEADRKTIEGWLQPQERITLVSGGAERQDSVFCALKVLAQDQPWPRWTLVHDGARPFCSEELLQRIWRECERSGAAIPVMPLQDTVRQKTPEGLRLLDRQTLLATQTPQGFATETLWAAYQAAHAQNWQTTDDASVVERYGEAVQIVPGEAHNLKITTPFDLAWANYFISQR